MKAVTFHRLLGNELTYRIVRRLGCGERCRPGELAHLLGASATYVSSCLRLLKTAGLVERQSTNHHRRGREVHYWLRDRRIVQPLKTLERRLKGVK